MGNSTPCKFVTPENIILKLCIRNYVGEMTHHANFGFNRCSRGLSPNRRNVTTLWLFWLSCPLLGVRTMGDVIWGNMTPSPQKKWAWIGKFKPKRQNIKIAILQSYKSDQDQIWGPSWYQQLHFMSGLTLPTSNPIWLPADYHPITTKFGRQMQNGMPMTIHRWKSKPEIEFQYGCRPFSETGSSLISAVDWDISSKFGMLIHFHLYKQIPSLNTYPEVDFRLCGRHLKKSIWRHNSAVHRPITTTELLIPYTFNVTRKQIGYHARTVPQFLLRIYLENAVYCSVTFLGRGMSLQMTDRRM